MEKTCCKCRETKPTTEFHKDKGRKDGLDPRCKTCVKLLKKKHYDNNVESERARARKKYHDNPEASKKRTTEWREKNKQRARETRLQWEASRKDELREYYRQWRLDNPDYNRERYAENPQKFLLKNHERRVKARGDLTDFDREVTAAYLKVISDDPCHYCGEVTDEMHYDHFYPVAKGGDNRWSTFVRSCSTCNLSKGSLCGTAYKLQRAATT